MNDKNVNIIGGGLAGCEAAWQLAKRGINVNLYEMRDGQNKTFAHKTDSLAELVCSNSFRSDNADNSAIGLLHQELRKLNSIIMQAADIHKVPAGGALAVDREEFAKYIERNINNHPKITVIRKEITSLNQLNDNHTIIATGPLTSELLTKDILNITGEKYLAFFDAIAPIIYKDSIDFSKAWFQSRYDKIGPDGDGKDYINCPMDKEQYENFVNELINGDKTQFKEWEQNTPYFNACLPIEVMAQRGIETLRFGPMKPVGLTNPHKKEKQYAVVQLRQDNKSGTLYNIVGFQTKLKYGEQTRIFRTIPGLENAEFARLGGIHRNTFINSPKLLDKKMRLKNNKKISFAGQITGVEGYVESTASGLMASLFIADEILGLNFSAPPVTTSIGSLLSHITENAEEQTFQPMNVNFGLMPNLTEKHHKKDRKNQYCIRSKNEFVNWLNSNIAI